MWLLLLIIFTFSLPKFLKKYFAEGIHKATVLQVKVLHVWVTPGFRLLNTIMLYRWSRIVEKYFWSGHSPTVVFQEAKFWVKWKEMTFDLKIFFSSGSFCSFITFKFFSSSVWSLIHCCSLYSPSSSWLVFEQWSAGKICGIYSFFKQF